MTIEARRLRDSRAVLLRTSDAPDLPAPFVDVRPGRFASYDGDRLRLPLWVRSAAKRTTTSATTPADLAAAVGVALPAAGPRIVRFGDRRTVRRLLPGARADALERRLLALAVEADATLVAWTTGDRRPGDRRRYDLVLDRRASPSSARRARSTRTERPGARPRRR